MVRLDMRDICSDSVLCCTSLSYVMLCWCVPILYTAEAAACCLPHRADAYAHELLCMYVWQCASLSACSVGCGPTTPYPCAGVCLFCIQLKPLLDRCLLFATPGLMPMHMKCYVCMSGGAPVCRHVLWDVGQLRHSICGLVCACYVYS
jgi:hypothetical protein